MTSKVKVNVHGFGDPSTLPSCTEAIRDSDAEVSKAVFNAPLGVAAIEFGPLPPLTVSLEGGPEGATVTWRPKPDPGLTDRVRRTLFVEQNGRWLVYRCCP